MLNRYYDPRQLLGMTWPLVDPPALKQTALVALFGVESLILCSFIPVQGLVLLQSRVIASGLDELPLILLYVTLLIFTPELCTNLTITLLEPIIISYVFHYDLLC